jgi:PAS domain S-box-containing protein
MGIPLRVLIVEDVEDDALLVVRELGRGGYDADFVRVDTPEAMSDALREAWDVVICDYTMPRFSGLAALKLLAKTGLDIPFIIVSGQVSEEIAVDAMRAGAKDFISKNNLSRLTPAISRELREVGTRRDAVHSEQALRASEERFRNFFENTVAGTAITSPAKGWIDVNDKLCQMLGYSREELSQMTWAQLTHPDDLAADVAQFDRLVAGEIEGYVLDKRFIRKDGTILPVLLSVSCIRDDSRAMKDITAILREIPARRGAEAAVRAAKAYTENLIKTANAIFVRLDASGNVVQMNKSAEEVTGYTFEEMAGRNWFDVIVPRSRYPKVWAEFERLATAGIVGNFENPILTKSGEERDIIWQNTEIREDDATQGEAEPQPRSIGTISFGLDVTERKQAEREKRQFYRDTIRSVTQGKLNLAPFEEVESYLDSAELRTTVASLADTTSARHQLMAYCASKGLTGDRLALFEAAVGEAITNAVKHAGEGCVYAGHTGNSVWVAVSDDGPGISTLTLPDATLRRGFSTKASMGMGYTIMMEASDEIKLCTGSQGTTVVLLVDTVVVRSGPSVNDFRDSWDEIGCPSQGEAEPQPRH